MRIVKLEIEDDALLSGVDAVALVETPAHEQDFYAFKKEAFESYTDYPESAVKPVPRKPVLVRSYIEGCAIKTW